MRILATADIHIGTDNSEELLVLRRLVQTNKPDVVAIAGDVHDYWHTNPFDELSTLGVPVVFCLGNHEFSRRSVVVTKTFYSGNEIPNVYCLDDCGYVDIDGVRFVGNILWYDGSLSPRGDVSKKLRVIDPSWLDASILNFDAVSENNECVKQIKDSLDGWSGTSVLVTHTVPYYKLNKFCYDNPMSVWNIYSGMKDLFQAASIYTDAAICGHTHRPAKCVYEHDDGRNTYCWNIGNDYYSRSNQILFEIIEV